MAAAGANWGLFDEAGADEVGLGGGICSARPAGREGSRG